MSDKEKTPAGISFYWVAGIVLVLLIGAAVSRFLVYSNTYYELSLSADDLPILSKAYAHVDSGAISNSIIITQDPKAGSILVRKLADTYAIHLTGMQTSTPSENLRLAFGEVADGLQLEVEEDPTYQNMWIELSDPAALQATLDQFIPLVFKPVANETWTVTWNGLMQIELPVDMQPVRHGPFDL